MSEQTPTMPEEPPPTVFDLLARVWDAGGPVASVLVDREGSAAAFVLSDGSAVLAPVADPEPAAKRLRMAGDVGQLSILQRTQPFGPLAEAALPPGAVTAIAASTTGKGFVVGTREGAIKKLTARGQTLDVATPFTSPVTALCAHPKKATLVAASGVDVAIFSEEGSDTIRDLTAPCAVTALGFAPDGSAFAAATDKGLWVVSHGVGSAHLIEGDAVTGPLAWSGDGAYVATGRDEAGMTLFRMADHTVHANKNYPAPVRSVAWSHPANALVTAGAFRAVAWSLSAPPVDGDRSGALVSGRSGLVLVEAVAAHPARPLLAVGYANGIVTLTKIGAPDEMMLSATEGAAVTALAFTPAGDNLALAHDDGKVAIVNLPPQLFK
ncbi:MAG: WD40 repeat domain-containing protein [Devosia sp.]